MWQMIPEATKIPVLCFDGDNAGRKAAGRVVDRVLALLQPGKSVSFAFMPDGEDPDSLIKASGVTGFKKIIDRATPLFDFIWHSHTQGRNIKTPDMKAAIKRQLENEIARIPDGDVQSFYKSELRGRISKEFYPQRNFGQFRGGNSNRPKAMPMRPQSPKVQRQQLVPKVLLAALKIL